MENGQGLLVKHYLHLFILTRAHIVFLKSQDVAQYLFQSYHVDLSEVITKSQTKSVVVEVLIGKVI